MYFATSKIAIETVSDLFCQKNLTKLRLVLALIGVTTLVACGPRAGHPVGEPFDPFEQENRKVHEFNKSIDRAFVRPAGKGYSSAVPDDVEILVGRFSFNLSIPQSVLNNALRGNMKGATEDLYRFVVNTTIGMGGLFDPASELNMPEPTNADFGMTLYAWGVPQGAYVELPLLGPSTERDAVGKFVDLFTNPLSYVLPSPEKYIGTAASVSSRLSDRGRFADTFDSILYESADSYAQARSLWLQKRAFELEGSGGDAYLDPYDSPYEDPYDE